MVWVIIWACVIAAAVIIEIATFALVSWWFAGGAIASIILAALNVDWMWQVIAFVLVSLGLLIIFRPAVKKFVRAPIVPTNADVQLGKKFKLLNDVIQGRSAVSINDVVWTVQVDGEYKAGDFVILKEISGNKYIAEGVKSESIKKGEDK